MTQPTHPFLPSPPPTYPQPHPANTRRYRPKTKTKPKKKKKTLNQNPQPTLSTHSLTHPSKALCVSLFLAFLAHMATNRQTKN
jgi:hypothetical protein